MPGDRSREVLRSIAANVRGLRAKRGLTQQQLADSADVDIRYLQKVEAAQIDFGVSFLVVLADTLEVKPATLLRPAKLTKPSRGRPTKRSR